MELDNSVAGYRIYYGDGKNVTVLVTSIDWWPMQDFMKGGSIIVFVHEACLKFLKRPR